MIVQKNAPKFNLRIPAEVKVEIERVAKENGRSANTEMVMRLIESLKREGVVV
ncbi:Arc family DNA-binding protein [Salmonella enterica]|nr:Arc family DNA-binding protein [Salmonella enterica subsp. enterica serovar Schwarzengrund]